MRGVWPRGAIGSEVLATDRHVARPGPMPLTRSDRSHSKRLLATAESAGIVALFKNPSHIEHV